MIQSITLEATGAKGKYTGSVKVEYPDGQNDITLTAALDGGDSASTYLSREEARQLAIVLLQAAESPE